MNRRSWFTPVLLAALGLILLADSSGALAIISIKQASFSRETIQPVPRAGVTAASLDSTLAWNTFLGGTSGEQGYGIAVE